MFTCNLRVIRFILVHSGFTDCKQKSSCLTRGCEIIIKITLYGQPSRHGRVLFTPSKLPPFYSVVNGLIFSASSTYALAS